MSRRTLIIWCLGVLISAWCSLGGQASAEQMPIDGVSLSVGEMKFFSLQHRDVVAIAVDTRMPTNSIADPLSYKLELNYSEALQGNTLEVVLNDINPALSSVLNTKILKGLFLQSFRIEQNSPSSVKISALFSEGVKPQVTTVKRKRVNHEDGTTDFRTYLVFRFPGATDARAIVVDPGHGGKDSGAVNNFLCEKDLNLDIGLRTGELFREGGYDVYMTRTDDTFIPLLDRADSANILGATTFISIHNNSIPTDMLEPAKKLYRGTTVLYNSTAVQPAKELAIIMCDELVDTLRTHKYPLQDRPGLAVLNSTWVPAVLAEVSMMPHPQDAKMISQPIYRQKAAEAIVVSTEKYLHNTSFSEGR